MAPILWTQILLENKQVTILKLIVSMIYHAIAKGAGAIKVMDWHIRNVRPDTSEKGASMDPWRNTLTNYQS